MTNVIINQRKNRSSVQTSVSSLANKPTTNHNYVRELSREKTIFRALFRVQEFSSLHI